MQVVAIKGTPREKTGTKAAKDYRRTGAIPAVIYGAEGEPVHFTTNWNDVKSLIYTPDFKLAEIEVDGKTYKCFLKEVQFHPVKETIQHIDFQLLVPGRKIKVEVPVRFTGTAPGVRAGGKLIQKVRRVKIRTTPEHLVSEVTVDISDLNLGQSVRVRDIDGLEGVEILNAPGIPLATIEIPRALRSAASKAEEAAKKKK